MAIRHRQMHEEWDRFRRMVLPPSTPPDQIREMCAAFYAGAAVLHRLLLDLTRGYTTATNIDAIREISSELDEFIQAAIERAASDREFM